MFIIDWHMDVFALQFSFFPFLFHALLFWKPGISITWLGFILCLFLFLLLALEANTIQCILVSLSYGIQIHVVVMGCMN